MANTRDFIVKNGLQINNNSTVAGDISLGDNNKLKFGASDDLQIYHSGTWSLIDDTGTGGLSLRSNDIRLEKYTGETLARFAADNAVFLYYDNSLKLQTTTTGIDVTGTAEIDTLSIGGTTVSATPAELNLLDGATVTTTEINYNDITTLGTVQTSKTVTANSSGNVNFPDGYKAQFGDGSDLQIYHDGSNSFIKDAGTGYLVIQANSIGFANAANNENLAFFTQDGAATLYYDNAAKIATTSTGIDVTGNITVSGTVDGRDLATDGTKLDGIESGATADQTITAGSGLTGGGTGDVTLYHADTSSQASVDNSNGTVIQDVTLDGYGHVTALSSVDLDGRYYTETEADSRFVNVTGDTMTGALNIETTGGAALTLKDTNGAGTAAATYIDFDDSNSSRVGYVGIGSGSTNDIWFYSTSGKPTLGSGNGSQPQYYNGSNSTYSTIWHAGNDGSGSGLDADTVDGIQAASFLRSDADDTGTGTYTFSPGGATGNTYFGSSTQTSYMNLIIRSNSGNAQIWKSGTGYSGYGGTSSLNIYNSNSNISFFSNGRTSYDMQISAGNVDVAGSITAAGGDGGARMGAWAYDSSYAMFGTANMTGQEYALLTNGTSTYLSGGSGGSVSIRGGLNDSDPQIEVTNDIIRIRKITSSEPDNVYFQFLDSGTEVGVIGTGYSDELYIASSGKSGIRFTANAIGFGNDTGTIVNNTYDLGLNSYRIRSGYFGTDVRAPVFYDIDDTTYYGNFASTSNFNKLNLGNWNASSYIPLNIKANTNNTGILVGRSNNYTTTFSVLPWGSGRTYLSSGTHYENGTWTIQSDGGSAALFAFAGADGAKWWAGTGGSSYSNVASEVQLWDNTGKWKSEVATSKVTSTDGHFGDQGVLAAGYALTAYDSSRYLIGLRKSGADANYPWLVHDDWNGAGLMFHFNGIGDRFYFSEGGIGQAHSDFRAPIFYDSNDTTYYVDPASYSKLERLHVGGTAPYGGGSGVYSDERMSLSVGDAGLEAIVYQSQYNDSSYPDYGLVFIHGASGGNRNVWSISPDGPAKGNKLGFLYDLNSTNIHVGTYRFWLDGSGNSYSQTSSRAPIFYDNNNTGFYVDPASTSNLIRTDVQEINVNGGNRNNSNDGTVYITATNNNDWGLIVNKYNGSASEYGVDIRMGSSFSYGLRLLGGGSTKALINSTSLYHTNDIRAPLFYDYNDTNYYIDPAAGFYLGVSSTSGRFVTSASSGGISIEGSSTGGPKVAIKSTATGGNDLWLISNNSGNAGGAGKLQFWNNSGSFTFAVFGTANTSDTTYIYCNLTASGNVTAYSDERLKENVVVIPDALDKVKAIRGVTFNRKDMEGNPRHAGVIAQEVEKVLPEVVSEDNEGTKTVAYGNMVGLLIEAIKELKDEVDDLKAQLAAK